MLKRNAIVKFVFLAIIAILGILLCVCPFSVPYSSNQYNGFIRAINKGVDLEGGVSAVYNCTISADSGESLSDAIDNSLSKIESVFKSENFSQLYVERQGGDKVYVLASADAYEVNKAFYYIEEGKLLSFTSASVSDTLTNPNVYLNSHDLKSVKPDYSYDRNSYGVTIEFSKEGFSKLKNLKKIAEETTNQTVYVYLGNLSSDNLLAEISTSDIGETTMFLTASSNGKITMSSADEAREVAYGIAGGMLDVDLTLNEVSRISPILGKNTQLYLGICLLITVIIAFILLCARYGELGLVGSLALVYYLVFFAFLLQSIPFITLNLAGVIGSVVAFALSCWAVMTVYEKIREEYAMGKKLHLAFKGGFKKALWPIVDANVLMIIASIFIWVIAPSSMKCFGIVLLIGALLSMFISLLLLRWFAYIYIKINSTKAGKLRMKRDKNVKEIKEEVETVVVVDDEAVQENIAQPNEMEVL